MRRTSPNRTCFFCLYLIYFRKCHNRNVYGLLRPFRGLGRIEQGADQMDLRKSAYRRIVSLLDEGTFTETGALITARTTDFNGGSPKEEGDGVITGYGLIEGKPVFVFSEDSSVLGGAMGEMHGKKIVSIYEKASKTGIPVLGLIDSKGLRIREATDGLEAYGAIMKAKAECSGLVPMIDLVFGRAGGCMAVVAGQSDFVLMEKEHGALFVDAPNTLTDGSYCDCEANAEEAMSRGDADFIGTEDEIVSFARTLIGLLPQNAKDEAIRECSDDLNRLTGELEGVTDVRAVVSSVADAGSVLETRAGFGTDVCTAFLTLDGVTTGVIGTCGPAVSSDGLRKAADFAEFLDAFGIPLLTLSNADGFLRTKENERTILRAAARTANAIAGADVPKVNVILGSTGGAPYLLMNAKGLGADLVYAVQGSSIRVMRPDAASKILGGDDLSALAGSFDENQTCEAAARRGVVDEIVSMSELRKKIVAAMEMLFTKRVSDSGKKHRAK